ncbi:OprD family porin [Pseudomonas putida CSV86]|uniref:OprD family porin n=1 Tax=Pseudomonas bharatica CSV86 TaxID=1005395 RepID=L1LZN8_9PSED|nr:MULTISPECIES: OprD family porin [Pseudomonas]MDG9885155.1 OprD family porin [Pseudomonas sp. GD04058]NNJ18132.1 OprD family porin [Pseudomonas bharatica CSV86]
MKKSTLTLAVALGVLAQQAGAAGFIEDSKATLKLRNFYINTDNRNHGNGTVNYQEEWGQGFQLDYTSGFTEGTVGFGVDAIGLLGIRLDSGKGRHGNASSDAYGGTVFPTDSDGRAVNDYSSLGAAAKVKISQTELRYGTLLPKNPVISYNDGRLLPQTFEGGQIVSNEIKDLTLTAGQIEHVKGRNSSSTEGLSIAGANQSSNFRNGKYSNQFRYAGADYKVNKDLLLQYWYGGLENFYNQHFLGAVHNWAIGPGVLKSDFRYFHSTDDGKNGDTAAWYTTGYYPNNPVKTRGKVDNDLYSALFLYTVAGHTFGGGYQVSNGDSDFPWLNQGDGSSNYTITDSQIQKFGRAGERTWQARYSYDFAKVGLAGATAGVTYLRGDDIDSTIGDRKEWERDITLAYVVPEGTLKGFGVMWKNATWRSNVANTKDQDENRLILSYSVPLL